MFDLKTAVQEATDQWKVLNMKVSPGGISEVEGLKIYTQRTVYTSGIVSWKATWEDSYGDSPVGVGRTEEEAIDDLKEKLE